jgi:hypothetical protein
MKAKDTNVKQDVRRRTGTFLRGPISWSWIQSAGKTKSSSALLLALTIRHFCDLRKEPTICISLVDLGCGLLDRKTVSRSLRLLESRGLILVERQPGQLLAISPLKES